MSIRFILSKYPNISRQSICKAIRVDKSNSYRYSKVYRKDQKLVAQIKLIRLDQSGRYYGLSRLKHALSLMGVFVGVNQIRRVCEAYSLKPKAYAKSPPVRDRGKVKSSIPNLLKPVLEEADHIKKTKSTPLFDLGLGSAITGSSTTKGLVTELGSTTSGLTPNTKHPRKTSHGGRN